MSRRIHIYNGPNINMTGLREARHYGSLTYQELCAELCATARELGFELLIRQSNHEGDLVSWLHEMAFSGEPLVINAGAYTHTSVAIRDALALVTGKKIEVHMSNVHAREAFRHHSYLSDVVDGVIVGLGAGSYKAALFALSLEEEAA
ncbi:type II 3-dehydroquinate dehydratase [Zobellella iuensis]|uniref:3-dehydroquinate dehydratase n=1 Tax=Zobellella iuensis TaxID=2803811 RepID=A0ABS1QLZ1_9GAMM|nr:type II 3-dehydroquinate dehydratase [Zobellella iuensis]MBL1375874.1 type II 3-dehydroquinate dehydratase [Zobellella iuensis]